MKRKEYEKPMAEVVELKQQAQLLAGSPVNGQLDDPDDYLLDDDPFSFAPQLPGGPNLFDF